MASAQWSTEVALPSVLLEVKECHLLIDGNSIFCRSFFAASTDPSFLAQGGAAQLGIRSICNIFKNLRPRPTHGLICWDCGSKTDKKRGDKPPEFQTTLEDFAPLVSQVFGLASVAIQGYEADDTLATAAVRSANDEKVDQAIVVSGDKDLAQLWGDKILYWSLNEKCLLSPTFICKKYGIKRPSHLPIALAILGDSVDNIHGVTKWGHKKVQKIFESLSPDATMLEAAEHAASFMNEAQLAEFETSLTVTLLNTNIEGVALPAPFVMNPEPLFQRGWEAAALAVKSDSGEAGQGDLFVE